MKKFSINVKLDAVLTSIYNDLKDFEENHPNEIAHYKKAFPREIDFNLVRYGNLLIYYNDVRQMYEKAGYKCDKRSNENLWDIYKRQVGYIARNYFK